MRLKSTYNFLWSGGPFCYRGIFSGLSNETVGAALYITRAVQIDPVLKAGARIQSGWFSFLSFAARLGVLCRHYCISGLYLLLSIITRLSCLPGDSNNFIMKTIQPMPPGAFDYYGPLLARFARRITGDEDASVTLTRQVLAQQYYIDGLKPGNYVRALLKFDLLNRCKYFLLMQVFDRAPVKIADINRALDLYPSTKNGKPS
ncbi:MAG: hypothetical protein JWP81_2488 [Ferruginibacter sp.]|nr:hypothetical protein [Ferruginibacter sp.]